MRRFIALLLLAVLPLQWGWAVAASYCQHEQDPAAAHIGHHVHRHAAPEAGSSQGGDAGAASATPSVIDAVNGADSPSGLSAWSGDADCGVCHGAAVQAAVVEAAVGLLVAAPPQVCTDQAHCIESPCDSLLRPPLPASV